MSPDRARSFATEVVVAALLAAATWLLYAPILRSWWTYDDPYHLQLLAEKSRLWYFWDTAVYRELPPKRLTPMLFLSLDVDRGLFGLRPGAFYAHQLLSLSLVPAALYVLLRLWLARGWAAFGAVVFLLGAPVAELAPKLMVRHYIEAIPLMATCVGAWVLAMRHPTRGGALSALSALAWLLAALAKEIAVPLLLFLPLIPEGTRRARARRLVPHLFAAGIYLALRYYFLGAATEIYGFAEQGWGWARPALGLPLALVPLLRGTPSVAGWGFLAALLVGLVAVVGLGWRPALRVAAGLALALAPILPVSLRIETRYVIGAWLVVAISGAFAASAGSARGGAFRRSVWVVSLATCVLGLAANRTSWAATLGDAERRSSEGRAFFAMGPGELLRQPAGVPGELAYLRLLKEEVVGLPRGTGWFFDDLFLCLHDPPGRVSGWDEATRRVVDLTPELPTLRRRHCGSIRSRAPLAIEIRAEGSTIAWTLGPYAEGRYGFVWDDGVRALELPQRGRYHLRDLSGLSFRVRYVSPAGWSTYSPELRTDLAHAPVFRWSRRDPPRTVR